MEGCTFPFSSTTTFLQHCWYLYFLSFTSQGIFPYFLYTSKCWKLHRISLSFLPRVIYRPEESRCCKWTHWVCLNSWAMECVFNLVWITALEEKLRAGKDHWNHLPNYLMFTMMRDPEKFKNWPKVTYWLVTLIILYSHCAFFSPLPLLCSSKQNWREPSISKLPIEKISSTFN